LGKGEEEDGVRRGEADVAVVALSLTVALGSVSMLARSKVMVVHECCSEAGRGKK